MYDWVTYPPKIARYPIQMERDEIGDEEEGDMGAVVEKEKEDGEWV